MFEEWKEDTFLQLGISILKLRKIDTFSDLEYDQITAICLLKMVNRMPTMLVDIVSAIVYENVRQRHRRFPPIVTEF